MACQHVQNLLKAVGNEKAGNVTLKQFIKLWKEFKASVSEDGHDDEEEIMKAFKAYDINGDGFITRDEIVKAIKFVFLGAVE